VLGRQYTVNRPSFTVLNATFARSAHAPLRTRRFCPEVVRDTIPAMNHPRYFSTLPRAIFLCAVATATAALTLPACDSGSTGSTASTSSAGGSGGTSATTTASSAGGLQGSGGATTGSGGSGPPGWVLAWSDEFNDKDGSPADPTKWTALVGGDGWGNQEREFYTDDPANAHQEGGNLVITATKEGAASHQCWYGACQYTSARLQTKVKFEQTYGRFEARIQIPRGQGIWPAFWMLGGNIGPVNWPDCGEIDIMENIGKEPGILHGTLHGPGYSGGNPLTGSTTLPDGAKLADAAHVFAVEWEKDVVRFYLDDTLYQTKTAADVPAGKTWVYDHPFFMLLNVAVGGGWPGDPDGTTVFPQSMKVDYVRVYQRP
jgi:beta-glucanase (GH16 family)